MEVFCTERAHRKSGCIRNRCKTKETRKINNNYWSWKYQAQKSQISDVSLFALNKHLWMIQRSRNTTEAASQVNITMEDHDPGQMDHLKQPQIPCQWPVQTDASGKGPEVPPEPVQTAETPALKIPPFWRCFHFGAVWDCSHPWNWRSTIQMAISGASRTTLLQSVCP